MNARVGPGTWRHALLESDLPPRALLVAHTLATFMDKHGVTYAGTRALAEGSNQSRKTAIKFLKVLVAEGYVQEDDYKLGRIQYRYAMVPSGLPQEGSTDSGLPQEGSTSGDEVDYSGIEGGLLTAGGGLPQEGSLTPRTPEENSIRDSEVSFKACPPHSLVRLKPGSDGEYCNNPKCHLSVPQRMKAKHLTEGIVKDIAS